MDGDVYLKPPLPWNPNLVRGLLSQRSGSAGVPYRMYSGVSFKITFLSKSKLYEKFKTIGNKFNTIKINATF